MASKELVLRGSPNPKQLEFFNADTAHVCYGGARGGGKSWAMRRKFVLLALRYDGLKLLLLRRTFPELEGNHIIPLQQELGKSVKYNTTQRVFLFPNGSFIKMGYCDSEGDVYQYQGQEYDVVGLEEATHFTESQMRFLTTCNRSTRTDFSPRMYYTCNPGGIGHAWVKRLFISRDFTENENEEDYTFIPATVHDNAVLMEANPQYIRQLDALPEHMRRMMRDGDWDVMEGQYFSEFRRDLHVVNPFKIPSDWKRFRSMDWGYNDPCAVLWFAVAPDRHIYVYRELYERHVLASDMARRIKKASDTSRIVGTWASPDAWQKRGASDVMQGESVQEVFAKNGVPLIKADNARIPGWQRVRENLAIAPDGKPYLQIFENCVNLIRTLPLLSFDTFKVEDVSDKCEDHAPEALRYGLMSRPSPSSNNPASAVVAAVVKSEEYINATDEERAVILDREIRKEHNRRLSDPFMPIKTATRGGFLSV